MNTKSAATTLRILLAIAVSLAMVGSADAAKRFTKAKVAKVHRHAKQPKAPASEPAKLAVPENASVSDESAKATASPTSAGPQSSELGEDGVAMTKSVSTIEAGVLGVTDNQWKFGQYNGLNHDGPYGIGQFDLRGGAPYDSSDGTRWRATGRNIGQETREFSGAYGNQGKYQLKFGYDEILRIGQGSYRTPYTGVGSGQLTLPDLWEPPTLANNFRTLPQSDFGLFHDTTLSTKRRRIDGGFSYLLDPHWEIKASMRHESKQGIGALGAPIAFDRGAVILPSPISQDTDQVNASLNYTGEKGFGQFAYYASIFHNNVKDVTFDNPLSSAGPGQPALGRMSTSPDNQFHQFNLNGGYNFSPETKLVATGSYGRNWQNEAFLPYNTSTLNSIAFLPRTSLGGDVETKSASLKLTHKVSKDLNLAAAYKYDERDNHTPVVQYFLPESDAPGPFSLRSNTPYSKRNQVANLDLNYTLAKGHGLKLGYELQNIDRWCNGTWTGCFDTGTTAENTGRIDYRGSFLDKLNTRLGYAYSHRSADHYNQDAAWAASFTSPQAMAYYNQITALGIPAWGPRLPFPKGTVAYPYPLVFPDNNPSTTAFSGYTASPVDIAGLGRFNTSSRDRQQFRGGFDYQATEKLSLGIDGNYRDDQYPDSAYGLQFSKSWAINLDTSYVFSEDLSAHVFYTYQQNASKTRGSSYGVNTNTGSAAPGSVVGGCVNNVLAMNNIAKVDPCLDWLANMTDNIDTVGFGVKHKGLFSSKLEVSGDFLYSFARTRIDVSGGRYVLSPTGTVADGPYYYINASPLPDVLSETFTIKLNAKYAWNKSSALHLTYLFQHLNSRDYSYIGMQPAGAPASVLPTFERAPAYSVNVIGLSYVYSF